MSITDIAIVVLVLFFCWLFYKMYLAPSPITRPTKYVKQQRRAPRHYIKYHMRDWNANENHMPWEKVVHNTTHVNVPAKNPGHFKSIVRRLEVGREGELWDDFEQQRCAPCLKR